MARYTDTVRDQNKAPIAGAKVYVTLQDGSTPVLTTDGGQVITQPIISDEYGDYHFNANDNFYDLDFWYGSRLVQRNEGVPVGNPYAQFVGPPGPAGPTFLTLAAFKAAPITNQRQSLKDPSIAFGDFFWTLGDFTGRADDENIIKADSTPLTVGAWVRQGQDSIARRTVPQLLASTEAPRGAGTKWYAEEFNYTEAAAGATDYHLITAGGVKLYVVPTGTSARQWGIFPDTGDDMADRLNNAGANHPGVLRLDEGLFLTSRGVRQQLNGSTFCGAGADKTILRGISPNNDGKMNDTNPNAAMVWALGAEGAPLFGLKTEDITLDCAGLFTGLPSGDVRMKGHHYRRVHGFEVNRVQVLDCGSYAFWANDKPLEDGGIITGCIGVYNDPVAKDAEIWFEAVGRCTITYNRPRALQTRDTWDWPVLETYHFYGGDGQIAVNDGYAKVSSSTVIGPALTSKNVTFNSGYYEQLNADTTAINMTGEFADFDNWAFNGVNVVAAGLIGPISFGGLSNEDSKMTITGGRWESKSSLGPVFTSINDGWGSIDITGLDCVSTTTGMLPVPFSLTQTGKFKHFQVVGGNQKASGPGVTASPVNAPDVRFVGTNMDPSGASPIATVRQLKVGSAVPVNSGGFGQINFAMPMNVVPGNVFTVSASLYDPVLAAATAYPIRWNVSGNIANILVDVGAVGKTFTYTATEYES